MCPRDAVAAPQPPVHGEQVHRPALAPDQAVPPAVQLGHDRTGLASQQQRVSVVPVAGDDPVPTPESAQEARGHRLLAGVEVQVAADLALAEGPLAGFLEGAHEHHPAVELHQVLRAAGRPGTVPVRPLARPPAGVFPAGPLAGAFLRLCHHIFPAGGLCMPR
jgi:hypothetical protein